MKARLNPASVISKAQRKAVNQVLQDELNRQQKLVMRRFFKLMCVSLSEDFGFGKERLMRVIDRISKVSAEHANDEIFWVHVDRRIEQLGLEFSKEDYDEMEGKGNNR